MKFPLASRFFLARIFLRHINASTLSDRNKRRQKLDSQIFSYGPRLWNLRMLSASGR